MLEKETQGRKASTYVTQVWSPLTQEGPSRRVENVPVNRDNKQHNVSPPQLKTNTKLWETATIPGLLFWTDALQDGKLIQFIL